MTTKLFMRPFIIIILITVLLGFIVYAGDGEDITVRSAAVQQLKQMSIEYNKDAFVNCTKQGNLEAVKLFLTAGMNPNTVDSSGWTVLSAAAWCGNIDIVKILLEQGADVNGRDTYGFTPLMNAAHKGYVEVMEILISYGADVNAKTQFGHTALMDAAISGHNEYAERLLHEGASVNAKNNDGWTSLLYAIEFGHTDIVQILLDHGADPNMKTKNKDITALILAAKKGQLATVQSLLNKDIDLNAKDHLGATALMYAANQDNSEIVRAILAYQGRPKYDLTTIVSSLWEENGKTAEINAVDNTGKSALMYAAEKGHIETVKLLVDKGANSNLKNKDGLTASKLAAKNRYYEVADLLRQSESKNRR